MATQSFALFFGNRGFFPESLIAGARREMAAAVAAAGFRPLLMDEDATPYGAVETAREGEKYARWLADQGDEVSGVILCLPNFGDETGAVAALRDAGVPILVQAYPDRLDEMDIQSRRDAFCGKFSVMDVFCQYGVPFTTFKPHTVHPDSEVFAGHLADFAAVCRVTRGMRRMTVGAVGARTTAFKTVRFDELTLERYGITTEVLDLSEVLARVRDLADDDGDCQAKADRMRAYTSWEGVPDEAFQNICRLAVVLDRIVEEYGMDALALRCWIELEKLLGISPCVVLSEMNDRGIVAACELDVCNAVAMRALALASNRPATCLDWNNNYGDDDDACILFHCGPVPQQLMREKGQVIEHPMFAKALGAGCGFGCNVGRIAASPLTFASTKTEGGKLHVYLGEGRFTDDPIPEEFFGCAGVARIDRLQDKLETIGHGGYRHHVGVTFGRVALALREAFERYLGYEMTPLP
jgi:L-fucose isomerase-like protein